MKFIISDNGFLQAIVTKHYVHLKDGAIIEVETDLFEYDRETDELIWKDTYGMEQSLYLPDVVKIVNAEVQTTYEMDRKSS